MEFGIPTQKKLIMTSIWEKQFQAEYSVNYFYKNNDLLHFIPELRNAILTHKFSGAEKRQAVLFCSEHFLHQQFKVNQYLNFSSDDRKKLRRIYNRLFNELEILPSTTHEEAESLLLKIEKQHYHRLRLFLKHANPFYQLTCENAEQRITPVVCEEYSAKFQLKLFRLQNCTIDEISPLLDIGCGKHAFLVKYLRKLGAAAYGFDRTQENRQFLRKSNWFDFKYGTQRWQIIISNLSFSSHFKAALCRKDGTEKIFSGTYMNILESLKIGGRWLYAPSLPEVEIALPHDKFEIETFPVNGKDNMTSIKRIKN